MSDATNTPPDGWIKMKELASATGLPKSTILHYVNERLLPEPFKTGPNVAFYDPACIERIGAIRQLQSRHRLPLAGIRKILAYQDKGREITPFMELTETIFGKLDQEKLERSQFLEATGLTPDELEELIKVRALIPLEDNLFDGEDVLIGRGLKSRIDVGLKPRDFAYYAEHGEQIVKHEFALRRRLTPNLSVEENITLTMDMTRSARAMRAYIIDRIFQRHIKEAHGDDPECDIEEP